MSTIQWKITVCKINFRNCFLIFHRLLVVFDRIKTILDYHWQSIDYQCLPCDLRYNIIVNQETSSSDAEFVTELNQVNIFQKILKFFLAIIKLVEQIIFQMNGETHLPGQYTDSPLLSTSLVDQFRGLPRSLIEKLYKIYFMDFLLFDYSIDEFINVADNRL